MTNFLNVHRIKWEKYIQNWDNDSEISVCLGLGYVSGVKTPPTLQIYRNNVLHCSGMNEENKNVNMEQT